MVIENAKLLKYNNDVNTVCTALEQAKSEIVLNGGMYPDKMYKQFSIKDLKSFSNSEFNEYVPMKDKHLE